MGDLRAVGDFFVEIDGLHGKLNLANVKRVYINANFGTANLHAESSQGLLRKMYSLDDLTVERQNVMDYVRKLCDNISSYDEVTDTRLPMTQLHTVNEIFRLSREFDDDNDRVTPELIDRFWDNIMTTIGIYFLTLDARRF